MHEWKLGIYQPLNPIGYLLRSKMQDMNKPRFYRKKPLTWNRELFDLMPVYEIIAD